MATHADAQQEVQPPQSSAVAAGADAAPICTDRPTKSNVPCVVGAGHWQVESDLFNGSFQRLDGVTTDTWYATNPTLKYGLAKDLDLEGSLAPYMVIRTHDPAGDHIGSGIGDLYLRVKYAAFSSASVQLSLIPYVKAPTARAGVGNGAWEGGLIAPIGIALSPKWLLTLSPEVDALKDRLGDGRHVNTSQTLNIGYSLLKDVTVYGELWGDWNLDPAGAVKQYSLDFAVSKLLAKRLQLDGGINLGLNHLAPGVQLYAGVSTKW